MALTKRQPDRIGRALIERSLLSEDELRLALDAQSRGGAKLGQILIGGGKITAYKFFQALADQLGLPFVNLDKEPCNPRLLEAVERHNYLALGAVPWKKNAAGTVILAVIDLTPEMKAWAAAKYPSHAFVMTSPFDIYRTVERSFAPQDDEDARESLWRADPLLSARRTFLTARSKYFLWAGVAAASLFLLSQTFVIGLFIAINVFYVLTLASKLLFFGTGLAVERQRMRRKIMPHPVPIGMLNERELPVYTVLVPLYREKKQTIENIVSAIRRLDYPKAKLDVKLIVESEDGETISHIKQLGCEYYFQIVRVPDSLPKTKPKACNYALRFAKGAYVTIYDAEDAPDPDQLKKAFLQLRFLPADVACLQARLNYYNRTENILTRMFSLEYASWFDYMLPGLEELRVPVPLGGTSNHFPTRVLKELHAWDPYNVTEDADLGIRLAQRGYRTKIADTYTMEEAPVAVRGWLHQRTRWLKGYMQTYLVHMRQPLSLYRKLGPRGFFSFLFFVGAPSIVFITIPFTATVSLMAYLGYAGLPGWFDEIAWLNLTGSLAAHWAIAGVVIARNKWWDMLPSAILFPFYWMLHIVSSFSALWQLITRPHYWDKTEHGLTKLRAA